MYPQKVRMNCPLCEWHYDIPPLPPVTSDTLASVFGHGVMINIAINRQNEKTEEALNDHLKTHSLVEWVNKVCTLERELNLLKSTFV